MHSVWPLSTALDTKPHVFVVFLCLAHAGTVANCCGWKCSWLVYMWQLNSALENAPSTFRPSFLPARPPARLPAGLPHAFSVLDPHLIVQHGKIRVGKQGCGKQWVLWQDVSVTTFSDHHKLRASQHSLDMPATQQPLRLTEAAVKQLFIWKTIFSFFLNASFNKPN